MLKCFGVGYWISQLAPTYLSVCDCMKKVLNKWNAHTYQKHYINVYYKVEWNLQYKVLWKVYIRFKRLHVSLAHFEYVKPDCKYQFLLPACVFSLSCPDIPWWAFLVSWLKLTFWKWPFWHAVNSIFIILICFSLILFVFSQLFQSINSDYSFKVYHRIFFVCSCFILSLSWIMFFSKFW